MGSKDKYHSFTILARYELEGQDYRRLVKPRSSRIAVIAPHGGGIEPGTCEIVKALAGDKFSAYCFEGTKPYGNMSLHITSIFFDEPMCISLVKSSRIVVAIHGCAGKHGTSYIGGLDEDLRIAVMGALRESGFNVEEAVDHQLGKHERNICNRGLSGKGLQIEITKGLRLEMFEGLRWAERQKTTPLFDRFTTAIRNVLIEKESEYQVDT
jgi:phage replication-related protein YjqB (UPF0714/DUF867 family)